MASPQAVGALYDRCAPPERRRHGSEKAWLRIDDEVVIAVHPEDVFGGQDSDE